MQHHYEGNYLEMEKKDIYVQLYGFIVSLNNAYVLW